MNQDGEGFWLIPPEIYEKLDSIYHFNFDPCPNPRPDGYDSLLIDWGNSNWVNPLFQKAWTQFGRKCISEYQKGKTVVTILPMSSIQLEMLRAGAKIFPLGWVKWLHTDRSGRSQKGSFPNVLWIFDKENRMPTNDLMTPLSSPRFKSPIIKRPIFEFGDIE